MRVHKEAFNPRPRSKGVPVYVCEDDICQVLWLCMGILAAMYTPISHACASQNVSCFLHVVEMYVLCVSLRMKCMHNLVWAVLLAILLIIGGVELNPGPYTDSAFATLNLDALDSNHVAQFVFVEQVNIKRCWDVCQANLAIIHQFQAIGHLDQLATICYACNRCQDHSLLCRLEHRYLASTTAQWLSNIDEYGFIYTAAEVIDSAVNTANSSALVNQSQTFMTPWQRNGNDYFDVTAVITSRAILTIDTPLQQCFAALQQHLQTFIVPMLGGQHFRLIIFHANTQSIYVWDPFGKSHFPLNVMNRLREAYPYAVHDIDISLQQDGHNCGFWVAYFTRIFCE